MGRIVVVIGHLRTGVANALAASLLEDCLVVCLSFLVKTEHYHRDCGEGAAEI